MFLKNNRFKANSSGKYSTEHISKLENQSTVKIYINTASTPTFDNSISNIEKFKRTSSVAYPLYSIKKYKEKCSIIQPENLPVNYDEVIDNIISLKLLLNLKENWNKNGAKPFKFELIEKCIKIIKKLKFQPEIFPTARESIQFEYEKKYNRYLEIEIFIDKYLYLEETTTGEHFEGEFKTADEMIEKINRFNAN